MKEQNATGNFHERARRLVEQERIEGLAPEERRWLQDHLAGCEQCAALAAETEAALRALKSISVTLPPGLASSANLRVRENAAELKQRRARNLGLIVGCAASWVAGVASAPLVWRLFEWVGTTLALPRIMWEMGFACWWFVPTAAAGIVILLARARGEEGEFDYPLKTGPRSDRW